MLPFQRRGDPYMLVAGMTGVRMGDHFAQIGCSDGGRLAALAGKVGLSGRAVAIVPDSGSLDRAQKGAARAGVLVDIETAPPTGLAAEDSAFDVVVIDNAGDLWSGLSGEDRTSAAREALRILRPGGRAIVISASPRGGLGALFGRSPAKAAFDATGPLEAAGFRSVRTLAEREGLVFVEGTKRRNGH